MNTLPMKEILSGLTQLVERKLNEDLGPEITTALEFVLDELSKLSNQTWEVGDIDKLNERLTELNNKLKTLEE